jgi:hypothetical protein
MEEGGGWMEKGDRENGKGKDGRGYKSSSCTGGGSDVIPTATRFNSSID